MYWLDGRDLPLKDILPPGAIYKHTPERISELEEALTYLSSPSISVKSAVTSDNYHYGQSPQVNMLMKSFGLHDYKLHGPSRTKQKGSVHAMIFLSG